MRVLIIGLGNQGCKRAAIVGQELVGTVDPVVASARYRTLDEVPKNAFDAGFVCTPDDTKPSIVRKLLGMRKHVLVEKPLLANSAEFEDFQDLARRHRVACYTAYNHRFEPTVVRLQHCIHSGTIGQIYAVRLFYGNGTACNVRDSSWRDRGLGVLADLGSHLLDLVLYLVGPSLNNFRAWFMSHYENRAPDHVAIGSLGPPQIQIEASLVSWRNTFQIDAVGAGGSIHVNGLCKWGGSTCTIRRRVLPSGRPSEEVHEVQGPDLTWAAEHEYFRKQCQCGVSDLSRDAWIARTLGRVSEAWESPSYDRFRRAVSSRHRLERGSRISRRRSRRL